jgi:hypothetical protein
VVQAQLTAQQVLRGHLYRRNQCTHRQVRTTWGPPDTSRCNASLVQQPGPGWQALLCCIGSGYVSCLLHFGWADEHLIWRAVF